MNRAGARLALVLGLLAAGAVLLWLTRDGEPPPADPIVWHEPDTPWGTLTGRVVDAEGAPVSEAEVLAQNVRGFGGLARTDSDGRYILTLGPLAEVGAAWPGRRWQAVPVPSWRTPVFVTARKDGFCHAALVREDVERGVLRDLAPLTLWRGGSVRGRVMDKEGRPLVARVRVAGLTSGVPRPPGLEGVAPGHTTDWTTTASDGTFALAPVGPGRAELWATAPGTGGGSVMCVVREGAETQVEIRVDVQLQVAGRVVDADGRGVAGVKVACIRERPRPAEDPRNGRPAREDPRAPGHLERGDPEAASARIRPFGRRPRDGGPPADDSVLERARRRGQFGTTTQDDGFFFFYGVRSDLTYRVLIVGAAGFEGAVVTGVEPPQSDVELRLPPRLDIRVVVRSRDGGEPIVDCVVQPLTEQAGRYLVRNLPLDLRFKEDAPFRTDGTGRCTIPKRYPGRYELLFFARGFQVVRVPAEVGAQPQALVKAEPVAVRLPPACTLTGRVTSSEPGPLEGAYVEAVAVRAREKPQPGSIQWTGRTRVACDADGRFVLPGLPASSRLRIRAKDERGHAFRQEIELEPEEVRAFDIRLEPSARLVVRLEPKGNGAPGGFPLRLQGIDDPSVDVEIRSDARGRIRLRNLMPGRYRVAAVHAKEDRGRETVRARVREIELRPGEDVELPIEIPDVTVVRGTVRVGSDAPRVARIGFGPMAGTPDHFEPLLFDVREGRFEGRMPPGTYHVNVNVPGRRHELPDPVEVPNEPLFEPALVVEPR